MSCTTELVPIIRLCTSGGVVTASRVILGDTSTGTLRDLSEEVELAELGTSGQARAVFGTCWRAGQSAGLQG